MEFSSNNDILLQIQIQQSTIQKMNGFCSSTPCFMTEEKKTEVQIPLIYQNPNQFYFPYEARAPVSLSHIKYARKNQFGYAEAPKYNGQAAKGVNIQKEDNLGVSQDFTRYSYLDNPFEKQLSSRNQAKENVVPIHFYPQIAETKHNNSRVYFNNQLVRSTSSQKKQNLAIQSNHSFHGITTNYLNRETYQKTTHPDIVPVSQYNCLMQDNRNMQRIIEEEYRPLKGCYESLRQEQKERQRLIVMLQHKVKQLGQKLKQQSVSSVSYGRY